MEATIEWVTAETLERTVALLADEVYVGERAEAEEHFADHAAGGGETWLAWVAGRLAGYVTIRWESHNPAFRERGIPLIHHLLVFEPYRRHGIGGRLMDAAERRIATRSAAAGITVGIFDAYGAAQRLYARRGYLPDGRGVCQGHRPLIQGETVAVDHDLILWMTKDLPKETG